MPVTDSGCSVNDNEGSVRDRECNVSDSDGDGNKVIHQSEIEAVLVVEVVARVATVVEVVVAMTSW